MYGKIFTAKIHEQLNLSWSWKFFYSRSCFIYHLSKHHEVPCKITYKTGYLFIYNTFTVLWRVQIVAAKFLLTSKEIVRSDLLLRQKARQNRQFIAEMFLLFSEFFGWRRFERRTKIIKWSSFTNVKGVLNRINNLNINELLGKKIKWVNKKPYYTVHKKYKYNWVSTRIRISFLVHPGWSPGFTVSLSAFGLCSIVTILSQNFRHMLYILLFQPGWSPVITVCLTASGICNTINILRQDILGKCWKILFGSAWL